MTRQLLFIPALVMIALTGCRDAGDRAGPGQPVEISGYGVTLMETAAPAEVVKLFITALEHRDVELLKKLTAVEYAQEDIGRIFRRHGIKPGVSREQAAGFAVSGWLSIYAYFVEGRTVVGAATVEGETATVVATGLNRATGKEWVIRVGLLREDGWWKVKHGVNLRYVLPPRARPVPRAG